MIPAQERGEPGFRSRWLSVTLSQVPKPIVRLAIGGVAKGFVIVGEPMDGKFSSVVSAHGSIPP
jgi:hypothetical protein